MRASLKNRVPQFKFVAETLDLAKNFGCNPSVTTASTTPTASKSKTLFWLAFAAAAAAVLDHIYLLSEHYALRYGEASGKTLCNINDVFNCAAVSASRFSEFLGIPMALWGAAANIALLILIGLYPVTDDAKKSAARRNLLLVSGIIALTSIVMGAISSLVLKQLCPFCLLAYALSFISFGGLWLSLRQAKSVANTLTGSGFRFADLNPVWILAALGLAGAFVTHQQAIIHYKVGDLAPVIRESLEAWQTQSPANIDASGALVAGATADQAKMVITEFADYRCIHCKHAAPVLKAFLSAHSDVRLQFIAWPLDGECNTAISRSNGASCLLARTVYCVEKTAPGKGWGAHSFIFENQDRFGAKSSVEAALGDIAAAAGADASQVKTCVESDEAKVAIEKQAAIGTSLNLQGTPTIYVNGKLLSMGQRIQVLTEAHKRLTEK